MASFWAKVKIFRFWPKTMDYNKAFLPKSRWFSAVLLLHSGRCYEAEICAILLLLTCFSMIRCLAKSVDSCTIIHVSNKSSLYSSYTKLKLCTGYQKQSNTSLSYPQVVSHCLEGSAYSNSLLCSLGSLAASQASPWVPKASPSPCN